MKYTIDAVDPDKQHVTFTVITDDGATHTETRCDLHYSDEVITVNEHGERLASPLIVRQEVDVAAALEQYLTDFNRDYMAAKALNEKRYGKLKVTA